MTKEVWINLPVKSPAKSKEFFQKLGFGFNSQYSEYAMTVGSKNVVFMLFESAEFAGVVQNKVTDTSQSSEVLFSFDGESEKEVDEVAEKVRKAGGKIFSEPAAVQGWMYGFAFQDLDGHRWNMLYMDMSKLPKSK